VAAERAEEEDNMNQIWLPTKSTRTSYGSESLKGRPLQKRRAGLTPEEAGWVDTPQNEVPTPSTSLEGNCSDGKVDPVAYGIVKSQESNGSAPSVLLEASRTLQPLAQFTADIQSSAARHVENDYEAGKMIGKGRIQSGVNFERFRLGDLLPTVEEKPNSCISSLPQQSPAPNDLPDDTKL
jgi:hypothetical protein